MWGPERDKRGSSRRGTAPVIGVVFLVGLIAASAIAMFVVGFGAISDLQHQADTEQAIAGMSQLSHDVAGSGEANAELPDAGTTWVDSEAGWMRVAVDGETVVDEQNGTLGALYYDAGDTRIAYQGGGVWRRDAGHTSTMVSPPPVQYGEGDDPMLDLPVLTLADANGSVDGEKLSTVETERAFPKGSENLSNPITGDVVVTVHSEFYLAWGNYFEDTFDGEIQYDYDAKEVELTLTGSTLDEGDNTTTTDNASSIGGFLVNDGGDLDIAQNVVIDSFDSTQGPYAYGNIGEKGHVKVDGVFDPSNDAEINGDVDATGGADLSNTIDIAGDVRIGYTASETRVSNDASIGGLLSIEGDAGIAQGAHVGEDLIVGGSLDTLGGTFDGDVHVHGPDSTIGDGGTDAEIDGSVYAGDDLEITNAVVQGDVYVRGDVDVGSAATIHGDVVATGTVTAASGTVGGTPTSSAAAASVPEPRDPIEPDVPIPDPDVDIDAIGTEFASDNDNGETMHVGTGFMGTTQLNNCGTGGFSSGCELTAGQYYLDEMDLNEQNTGYMYGNPPEHLTLDTTDGPIEIYVDGDVLIEDPATVEVIYDEDDEHAATIYTNGDFRLKQGATVEIDDDRTPMFEVFTQHDATARVEGGSVFRGALYGLEQGGTRTEIDLSGGDNTEFYGAMLGNVGNFDQEAEFHYDTDQLKGRLSERDDSADDSSLETESADVVYLHLDARTVQAS